MLSLLNVFAAAFFFFFVSFLLCLMTRCGLRRHLRQFGRVIGDTIKNKSNEQIDEAARGGGHDARGRCVSSTLPLSSFYPNVRRTLSCLSAVPRHPHYRRALDIEIELSCAGNTFVPFLPSFFCVKAFVSLPVLRRINCDRSFHGCITPSSLRRESVIDCFCPCLFLF